MATTHDNVDDCGDFQNQRRDSWLEWDVEMALTPHQTESLDTQQIKLEKLFAESTGYVFVYIYLSDG